ncbi:MAG: hypothetical protein O3C40_13075 [Planctomycetota bacterium]|nr:hypothetical protein [Planctomycetota bacterium]
MRRLILACLSVLCLATGGFAQQARDFTLDSLLVYDIRAVATSHEIVAKTALDVDPRPLQLAELTGIGVPVRVEDTNIQDPFARLTWYRIAGSEPEPPRLVVVQNRFGSQRLTLGRSRFLLAPGRSTGAPAGAVSQLDYFVVYDVIDCKPFSRHISLAGVDGVEAKTTVDDPRFFAVPAAIEQDGELTQIIKADEALLFYPTQLQSSLEVEATVVDSLAHRRLTVRRPVVLGVPTHWELVEPITGLDHFRVYDVPDVPFANPQFVRLQGVFDPYSVHATARQLTHVATPVAVDDTQVFDAESQLIWYAIDHYSPDPTRTVTIWNRFGEQELTLGRAAYLLTPAPSPSDIPRPREGSADASPKNSPQLRGFSLRENAPVREKMGLAPSGRASFPSDSSSCEVPVPIFSQRLRENASVRTANGHVPVSIRSQPHPDLDHYKVYVVLKCCRGRRQPLGMQDRFGTQTEVPIGKPLFFCVPTTKKRGNNPTEPIQSPDKYLTFYHTAPSPVSGELTIEDQFGTNTVSPRAAVMLGVPTHRFEVFPRIRPYPNRDLAIPNPNDIDGITEWFESLLKHAAEEQ